MRQLDVRFDIHRNGVFYKSLREVDAPYITMMRTAAIKTSLSGSFVYDADIEWLTDDIRPKLIIDGTEYSCGIFLPSSYRCSNTPAGSIVKVEAFDRCWQVQTVRTETVLHLPAGTNYLVAIKSLLTTTGIALVIETPTASILTNDREDWPVGTDYLEIINTLLAEINYNTLWFNADGYAIIEPASSPDAANIDHILDATNIKSLVMPEITVQADYYDKPNVYIVVCSNPDNDIPMVAVAENTNPGSALSILSRGRRISQVVKVDNIADQSALEAYANRLLFESMLSGETINVSTALLPGYGVGDVVAINHGTTNGICVENAWTMMLQTGGEMRHSLEKVVFV